MNRKLFSLLTAGALVLLSSCGDSVVDVIHLTEEIQVIEPPPEDPAYNPIQTKASLNVVVRSASTGELIGDASVKLTSSGEEKLTDASNGAVSFDSLYGGTNYTIIIEKDGYASVYNAGTVINNTNSYNIYIAQEQTVNVTLYPKTASLSGTLYYTDINDANVSKPASGAQVLLQYNTNVNFLDRYDTADVGSDGKFAFNNLAAVGTDYTLTALEFKPEDGRTLKATNLSEGNPSLEDNTPAHYPTNRKLQYGSDVTQFILVSHPSIVEPTDSVVFIFSDNINLSKITDKLNAVTTNGGTATFEWGANSLTITPLNEWSGDFDVIFNNITLYSVNGSELNLEPTYSIGVNNPANDISKSTVGGFIDVSPNVSVVPLQWTKVSKATSYEIFYKAAGTDEYVFIIEVGDVSSYSYNFESDVVPGSTHYFAIRALNSTSQTKFSYRSVTISSST